MRSVVYLVDGNQLVAMERSLDDAEDVLQRLLATDARLLGGAASGEASTRRWILIRREALVRGASGRQWSADHLFVDCAIGGRRDRLGTPYRRIGAPRHRFRLRTADGPPSSDGRARQPSPGHVADPAILTAAVGCCATSGVTTLLYEEEPSRQGGSLVSLLALQEVDQGPMDDWRDRAALSSL